MDVSTWSIVYNIIHTYVQGHGDLCLWFIELQLDWSCLLFTLSNPIIGRIYITCIYIIHVGLPMNPILDSLWFTWFNVFVFYRIWLSYVTVWYLRLQFYIRAHALSLFIDKKRASQERQHLIAGKSRINEFSFTDDDWVEIIIDW